MALQTIPYLIDLNPWRFWNNYTLSDFTIDAAGESVFFIGPLVLSSGPGTSKTLSSAGGKIHWMSGSANTFANAGTNVRVGVNDLLSTGLEDGTHDVYADLVGGTDTIANDTVYSTAMETGTKSMTHGTYYAIGIEMTARGGTDSITVQTNTGGGAGDVPNSYQTRDSGSGPAKVASSASSVVITFDDGTLGWIGMHPFGVVSVVAPTNATTPDEYATIFAMPFKTQIVGISVVLDNIATTDTFELILYSDPLGTPVAERTITCDPNFISGATADGVFQYFFTSAFTPTVGTNYAVAFRPTSTGAISLYRAFVSDATLRVTWAGGTNISQGTRTDQTGAFTQDTTYVPHLGPIINALDDGVGGGGGGGGVRGIIGA